MLVTDHVLIPIPDESRTGRMSSRNSRAHATLRPDSRNTSSIFRMDEVQDLHNIYIPGYIYIYIYIAGGPSLVAQTVKKRTFVFYKI